MKTSDSRRNGVHHEGTVFVKQKKLKDTSWTVMKYWKKSAFFWDIKT
jgi:hypothetical protein